jgi:hypothetical protein
MDLPDYAAAPGERAAAVLAAAGMELDDFARLSPRRC